MPKKYAIRITEDNIDKIRALDPMVDVNVKEDTNRFFLYTEDPSTKMTTQHDVVEEVDLATYDGNESGTRTILE